MPYIDTIRAVHYNLKVRYVCPQYVSFTPSIDSWQISEITCLNEKIFFSYTLFICYSFSFQHKLHQSTNMYNYHGNGSAVSRSGCSNLDESFGYYDSNDVVVVI